MPQLQRPAPAVSAPATAPTTTPAAPSPDVAQAATIGNQEAQARLPAAPTDGSSLLTEDSSDAITHDVKETVSQTISNAPRRDRSVSVKYGATCRTSFVASSGETVNSILLRAFAFTASRTSTGSCAKCWCASTRDSAC